MFVSMCKMVVRRFRYYWFDSTESRSDPQGWRRFDGVLGVVAIFGIIIVVVSVAGAGISVLWTNRAVGLIAAATGIILALSKYRAAFLLAAMVYMAGRLVWPAMVWLFTK